MSRDYTEITDEQLRALNRRVVEQPSHEQLLVQNRVLRGWLGKALDRAREHNEGCLYCGEGEIIDGETTPEHRAECWWYRAQAALTATSQEPTA